MKTDAKSIYHQKYKDGFKLRKKNMIILEDIKMHYFKEFLVN